METVGIGRNWILGKWAIVYVELLVCVNTVLCVQIIAVREKNPEV